MDRAISIITYAAIAALCCAAPAMAQTAQDAASPCAPTQFDALGPFYISNAPMIDDLNRFGAPGEPMTLTGRVLSADPPHAPIPGALVEIWQTDGAGRYYPEANGTAAFYADEMLDLRGSLVTDEAGEFSVKTLLPGTYVPRPRHIHYVVSAPGYALLVTQHYLSTDAEGPAPYAPCRGGFIQRDEDGVAAFDSPPFYLRPSP